MTNHSIDYQNISSESAEELNHHSLNFSNVSIKVESLSKIYKLYNTPMDRLKETMHPFRKKYHKDFFALKDISFEVKKGETFGIIGKNGSGKSTLLKIITGVLSPSSGNVTVNGRVSSLLELGAGFNPELNGIENIYFYGTINGFSKEEMDSRLDSILAFADIGEFVFQPVKSYSSGMYVRLAFAVAIQVDPEILIIDEALSVGDIFFQQKCHAKMEELSSKGVVLLFVSHDMMTIQKYCRTVLFLEKGKNIFIGDPNDAVTRYYMLNTDTKKEEIPNVNTVEKLNPNEANEKSRANGFFWPKKTECIDLKDSVVWGNTQIAEISFLSLSNENKNFTMNYEVGEWVIFYIEFRINQDIEVPLIGIEITNSKNLTLYSKSSLSFYPDFKFNNRILSGTKIRTYFKVKLDLIPDEYTFSVGLSVMDKTVLDEILILENFEESAHKKAIGIIKNKFRNFTIMQSTSKQTFPFYGLVGLQDSIELWLQ